MCYVFVIRYGSSMPRYKIGWCYKICISGIIWVLIISNLFNILAIYKT